MPSTTARQVVILGTGGTIAGTADDPLDNVGYTAAQRGVAQLLAAVPALAGQDLLAEQVAQVDSKDMDATVWLALARRCAAHLARPEVAGVVVTHGTDTLEETAWFLHRVLAPGKPLVLTAAMRPATALLADGPQNLLDAVTVAHSEGVRGVVAVLAGRVHAAARLRKVHPYRVEAFSSGEAGPLALVEEGQLRTFQPWPPATTPLELPAVDPSAWPWVEVLLSHAGARPDAVRALCAAGVRGLVVATTGNGTVHGALETALAEAERGGVAVWRATRCADGAIVGAAAGPAAAMSPWQARIELQLRLLCGRGAG